MATLDVRSGSNDRGLVASDTVFATARGSATANAGVEGSGDDLSSSEFFTPTYFIRRSAIEFDTSSMGTGAVATAGTLKLTLAGVTGDTDNYSVNIFYFTRASTGGTAFEATDYNEALGTAACDTPKDITGLTGEQTFTLNANALAAINETGYTQFSVLVSGDSGNSTPTGGNLINGYRGTDATESNRPRLELTYTPGFSSSVSPSVSPSASTSPSSSASASTSPSSSVSASISPSTSMSPSTSVSASVSPSASTSPSASVSASVSPSSSVSPSLSPSTSISASPSQGYSQYTRQAVSALPSSNSDLQTLYSEDEEDDVSASDNVRVAQTGTSQYMLHQFKNFVGSHADCQINWEGQSTVAPNSSTVYLQLYHQSTGWETVDQNNTAEANTDFMFTYYLSDVTNYKDAQNVISVRVYQLAT